MTKDEALTWGKGAQALAHRLGMTTSAVCQWTDVPLLQQYRLAVMSGAVLVGGSLTVDDPLIESMRKRGASMEAETT